MSNTEIRTAIKSGKKVYWKTFLYEVKIDFDDDLVVKNTDTNGQQLLDESFNMNDFFAEKE